MATSAPVFPTLDARERQRWAELRDEFREHLRRHPATADNPQIHTQPTDIKRQHLLAPGFWRLGWLEPGSGSVWLTGKPTRFIAYDIVQPMVVIADEQAQAMIDAPVSDFARLAAAAGAHLPISVGANLGLEGWSGPHALWCHFLFAHAPERFHGLKFANCHEAAEAHLSNREPELTIRSIHRPAEASLYVIEQLLSDSISTRQANKPGAGRKRRGRRPDTDTATHKQIYKAWKEGQFGKYSELAREMGVDRDEVAEVVDRYRKRVERAGKNRQGR